MSEAPEQFRGSNLPETKERPKSQKAVDIVLLPSEEMTNEALKLNQQLLKNTPGKIVLGEASTLPHISLAMGVLNEKDMARAEEILKDIAKQFSPVTMEVEEIKPEPLPDGGEVTGLKIKKSEALQALHEAIVKKFQPLLTNNATLDMLSTPSEDDKQWLSYINNYTKDSSFENFSPHITLGLGRDATLESPDSFTASRLALCHLGSYCTCSKVIKEITLEKDSSKT